MAETAPKRTLRRRRRFAAHHEHAGRVVGIGTYRPRFGRFEVAA